MRLQIVRKTRRGLPVVVVVLSAALLASACSGSGSTSGSETTKAPARANQGKVIFAALQDPGTMDIVTQSQTALALWIPGNVYEPLIRFKPDGTAPAGDVAESWDISKDQLTYTFHIRDMKFSNGDKVTADDVVYSLTQMQNGPVGAYAAPYAFVESITATDAKTVMVKLKQASRAFFKGMGGRSALIQPKAAAATRATKPIGSGPYVMSDYVPNDHLTFDVNPNYWGPAPKIKQVTVKIIPDGNAALNALRAGEVDAFPTITIDLWERLKKGGYDKDFKLVQNPALGEMLYAVFNDTKAPYNDPKLRNALAKAIDRNGYVQVFGAPAGSAIPTCDFGKVDSPWVAKESISNCSNIYNPEAAKKEFTATGYTGTPLNFVSLTDVPDVKLPADVLIGQYQAAGAAVERKAISLADFSTTVFGGKPPQFGMTVMSSPWQRFFGYSCASQAKRGWTTYCSAEFTALLAKADAAPTDTESNAYLKQADEVLKKDAVIVPILAKSGIGLFHPGIQGVEPPSVDVEVNFASLHW